MSDHHLALVLDALCNRLTTDLEIQALLGCPVRLYETTPEDTHYPYMTYEQMRCAQRPGQNKHQRLTISLHIWARRVDRSDIFSIMAALTRAFEIAPLALTGGQSVKIVTPYMDILRAPDGHTLHGLMRLSLTVLPTE